MLKAKFAVCLLILFSFSFSAQAYPEGLSFNYNGSIYSNLVSGASNRTYLQDGGKSTHDLNIGYLTRLEKGQILQFSLDGRQTNDRNLSASNSELNDYLASFKQPETFEITFGKSVSSQFSQYSLTRSLEGILGRNITKLGKQLNFEIVGVAGESAKAYEGSSFARRINGIRIENKLGSGDLLVGANYVRTWDDAASISNRTGLSPIENSIVSVDSTLIIRTLSTLTLKSEVALSNYDQNTLAAGGDLGGRAARLDLDYRHGFFSLNTNYEETGANFYTFSGGSSRDQRRYRVGFSLQPHPRFSAQAGFENYHNNVSNYQDPSTLFVRVPSVSLNFKPFVKWNNFNLALSYRNQGQKTNSGSLDTASAATGLRIANYWGSHNLSLDFNVSQYRNYVTNAYDSDLNAFGANLGTRFSLGSLILVPGLAYNARTTAYLNRGSSSVSDDTIVKFKASAGEIDLDSSYQNSNSAYTGGDTLNSGVLSISLVRKLSWQGDLSISLDYRSTAYRYSDAAKNYATTVALSKVSYAF